MLLPGCLVLWFGYRILLHDIQQELRKGGMKGIPAEDVVQYGVDKPVAEFDKGIQFTGVSWLLKQKLPELLLPFFLVETKSVPQLIEQDVDVHQVKMVGDYLGSQNIT